MTPEVDSCHVVDWIFFSLFLFFNEADAYRLSTDHGDCILVTNQTLVRDHFLFEHGAEVGQVALCLHCRTLLFHFGWFQMCLAAPPSRYDGVCVIVLCK